jgi:PAS domain S-box-containing protein
MIHRANDFDLLVIEDNPADMFLLVKMLNTSGLGIQYIHTADNIAEAHQLLSAHPSIRTVLLDLSLPDSFGLESYFSIRDMARRIPVIILTGMSDASVALEALKEGAQDYLVKGQFSQGLLSRSIQYSIERKQNLESLEQNIERFNLVAKATNDVVWDRNLVTNEILFVGNKFQKLFGYDITSNSIPGDTWENWIHPADKEKILARIHHAITNPHNNSWQDEYRLKKADGTFVWVHDRGYITYDENHRPVRMIGATANITERKMQAEKVKESEARYRYIFNHNPFPSFIVDLESLKILEVNDSASEKYQYSRDEFLRMTIKDIRPQEDRDEFLHSLEYIPATEVNRNTVKHKKKDGTIMYAEVTYYPVAHFGKAAMQAQVNDVTDKIKLEKELADQQKQKQIQITTAVLAAQEKERTKLGEELHDNINQIIVSAKLYLDMATKKSEEPLTDMLKKSSRYLAMAVEEMRKLSRTLVKPSLGDHTLILALADIMDMMKQASPVKVKLDYKNLSEEKLTEEQQLAIYRIVQEQMNNIVKHAEADNVTITLDNTSSDQVILRIEDDGKGFDPSVRRKGVGITNINSRAEVLNGKVEIDTAPGQGCRLKVVFDNKIID